MKKTMLLISLAMIGLEVGAQVVRIPDIKFKNALIEQGIDLNNNGKIETREAKSVGILNVANKSISDLTGIGAFTSLTNLNCAGNAINQLDLSANRSLEFLTCSYNELTKLTLTKNKNLKTIDCSNNQLTSLKVFSNTLLQTLVCSHNYISKLDVTVNKDLQQLICNWNTISTLNISHNPNLTKLNCSHNAISNLDLSKNIALTFLDCGFNGLAAIDVTALNALDSLEVTWNSLTSIDLSKNSKLKSFICQRNKLTKLSLRDNKVLTYFDCTRNTDLSFVCLNQDQFNTANSNTKNWQKDLTTSWSLCNDPIIAIPDGNFKSVLIAKGVDLNNDGDIQASEALEVKVLNVNNKNISSLEGITAFYGLRDLSCDSNKLTAIELPMPPDAKYGIVKRLSCAYNQIASLDNLAIQGSLKYLNCQNNALKNISLLDRYSPYLDTLYCNNNELTNLEVYFNMVVLNCQFNKLSQLNVGRYLKNLNAENNQLLNLDLRNAPDVTALNVKDNAGLRFVCLTAGQLQLAQSNSGSWQKNGVTKWSLSCTDADPTVYIPDDNFKKALIDKGLDLNEDGSLQESEVSSITVLNVNNKNISNLEGINAFTSLVELSCDSNQLTYLYSNNNITKLSCARNQINSLDVSEAATLKILNFTNNTDIPVLDIRNNTQLTYLNGQNNPHLFQICVTPAQLEVIQAQPDNWLVDGSTQFATVCSTDGKIPDALPDAITNKLADPLQNSQILHIYNLLGKEVSLEQTAGGGIFIYQYKDGSIRKIARITTTIPH